jgi:hypothetical protein
VFLEKEVVVVLPVKRKRFSYLTKFLKILDLGEVTDIDFA